MHYVSFRVTLFHPISTLTATYIITVELIIHFENLLKPFLRIEVTKPLVLELPLIKEQEHTVLISVKLKKKGLASALVRDWGCLIEFTSVCGCMFWTLTQAEY